MQSKKNNQHKKSRLREQTAKAKGDNMQLIKVENITIGIEVKESVNARELHSFLESKADFSTWIKTQISRARLVEELDYVTVTKKVERQILVDYHLSLEAGKSIGMMSATDKGFEIRDYFIECERKAKTLLPVLPVDPVLAQLEILQTVRKEQIALEEKQRVISVGLAETRHDVNNLKQNMRVENWQQCNLKKAVDNKIQEFRELYPSINVAGAYSKVWRYFKNKYQIPRYQELPAMKYEDGLKTIHKLAMHNLAGL